MRTTTNPESYAFPPMLHVPKAVALSGLSRSEIYRRLVAGDIRAVKSGRTTLIVGESLGAYLATLPAAQFRAPGPARRARAA